MAAALGQSQEALHKLAHDAARKAGFCKGSECTAAEVKAWARKEGKAQAGPLGAIARLLGAAPKSSASAEDDQVAAAERLARVLGAVCWALCGSYGLPLLAIVKHGVLRRRLQRPRVPSGQKAVEP